MHCPVAAKYHSPPTRAELTWQREALALFQSPNPLENRDRVHGASRYIPQP